MLDRLALAARIEKLTDKLFPELEKTIDLAVAVYKKIAADTTFAQKAQEAQSSFLVPFWQGHLCDVVGYTAAATYDVLAIDGSQVYPDRHVVGAGCFLINIGGVHLAYNAQSSVKLFSTPEVCAFSDFAAQGEMISHEIVDLLREERELAATVTAAEQLVPEKAVVFVDGTLIFWVLESKDSAVQKRFLSSYMASLEALYQKKQVVAGYISLPKSREVMSLVKLGLCRFSVANCIPCHSLYDTFPCKAVDALLDVHIMSQLLEPGARSILFATSSHIVTQYPPHLRPWFCYLHVGSEIVRLEMPAWVAGDEALVARVCQVALDQAQKGGGYPVVLAEAHEQAVVKSADREFFYQLLVRIGMKHNKTVGSSLKSIAKKTMRF